MLSCWYVFRFNEDSQINLMTSRVGHHSYLVQLLVISVILLPFVIPNEVLPNDIDPKDKTKVDISNEDSPKNINSKDDVIKGQVVEGHVVEGHVVEGQAIEGHCDSDKVGCHVRRQHVFNSSCLQYDAEKFKTSPSLFTFFPMGRLGNTISAYLVKTKSLYNFCRPIESLWLNVITKTD